MKKKTGTVVTVQRNYRNVFYHEFENLQPNIYPDISLDVITVSDGPML